MDKSMAYIYTTAWFVNNPMSTRHIDGPPLKDAAPPKKQFIGKVHNMGEVFFSFFIEAV